MDKVRSESYKLSLEFILKSLKKNGGSSAYFSRFYFPLKGWSEAYPETTGYLIPTLFDAGKRNEALELADWVCGLQYEDGGLPGDLLKNGKKQERSIFNTAQMLIGLVRAAEESSDGKYFQAAKNASEWLANIQEPDGTWKKYHYKEDFFPSYYSRVAWPMLAGARLIKSKTVEDAAIKTFDHIQSKKLKKAFIQDSGFEPKSYAFLHTIAYTIRGFLEAHILTKREDYLTTALDWSTRLMRQYELKKKLAGAYFEDWKKVDWYRCLTGEAQMCIIWLKIFELNEDARFLNASIKLLDDLCKAQPKATFLLRKGGLPGSKPFYGRYIALRQPNWATKFFMDALYLEEILLAKQLVLS